MNIDNNYQNIKHKINLEIENIFTNNINKYVKYIYAGQTSQSVEDRFNQHIKEDSKFVGMEPYELTSLNIHSPELAANAEQYLINKISKCFYSQCLNAKKKNGKIAQLGGVGESQRYELHRLYVLIKFVEPQINFV